MNILVLAGGISNEREVSLRSGHAVVSALQELGYGYQVADPAEENFDIKNHLEGVDVVFFALHGAGGEDGYLQEQLETLGVKFVGSGSKASKICWNKWNYKELLKEHSLPASKGEIITDAYDDDLGEEIHERFNSPFVLKPNRGGSSLDTLIVRSPTENDKQTVMKLLHKYPAGMLFEPLIDGTEITVGVLGNEALPIVEIVPPQGKEFDYENKYNGESQELCPPEHVSEDTQTKAKELALKIHRLTGCRHMSRTDMIIDEDGNLHVLETNTIPGMTEQSLLPKMAHEAGYSMPEFVDKLLKMALAD